MSAAWGIVIAIYIMMAATSLLFFWRLHKRKHPTDFKVLLDKVTLELDGDKEKAWEVLRRSGDIVNELERLATDTNARKKWSDYDWMKDRFLWSSYSKEKKMQIKGYDFYKLHKSKRESFKPMLNHLAIIATLIMALMTAMIVVTSMVHMSDAVEGSIVLGTIVICLILMFTMMKIFKKQERKEKQIEQEFNIPQETIDEGEEM